MRVDVDVGDPHALIREQTTHDRRIVVDAEARGAPAHRVMQSTREVHRDAELSRECLLHRDERSAGGEEADLMYALERRRVAVRVEPPLRIVEVGVGGGLHHGLDVLRRVDPLDLRARRRARREYLRPWPFERAEPLERVVDTDEALRLERVVIAVDVRRDARVPDKARAGRHGYDLRMRSSVTNLNG